MLVFVLQPDMFVSFCLKMVKALSISAFLSSTFSQKRKRKVRRKKKKKKAWV